MKPDIRAAAEVLKRGGIVVYPTDTCYGLAVDATNPAAVKKLCRLKGRNFKKPIHVVIPAKHLHTVPYASINPAAKKLIKQFWPGPLTLVLPLKARGKSWQMLSAGTGTIGVRYPKHKLAQDLVNAFGKPITATSANLAGRADCYSVAALEKQFKKHPPVPNGYVRAGIYARIYVLDAGQLPKRKPSTVVALTPLSPSPSPQGGRVAPSGSTSKRVRILRRGLIGEKAISRVLRS